MTKPLTIGDLKVALAFLDVRAGVLGKRYAVIGGALFKLLGIEGVETSDIDVAADGFLDLPSVPPLLDHPSFCPDGHYRVNGISIDWMPEGKRGSWRLFREAINLAYLSPDGIWLAPLDIAMAIKVFAGRPKDIELFERLVLAGRVSREIVMGLIEKFCEGGAK